MRKSPLNVEGKSTSAQLKRDIQAWLRVIVTKRDGGCILKDVRPQHTEVLQADHLITRANSATYADSRLVVGICTGCHFWKKWNKEEYDRVVKRLLPKDRQDLWDKCEMDRHHPTPMGAYEWKMALIVLKNEAKDMGITPKAKSYPHL